MIVDGYGRVIENLEPIGEAQWVAETISRGHTTTDYERYGLTWFWVTLCVALAYMVFTVRAQ
jgi:apolipoprotein N-acyltransferase